MLSDTENQNAFAFPPLTILSYDTRYLYFCLKKP